MACTRRGWLALLSLAAAPAAIAQTDVTQEFRALDEIVVTATLREVNLHDLPMSVGVLTEEQLRDINALSIEDYWRLIPSLAVRDAPFGGQSVVMRGLTDTDSFLSTESINAFYADDTAITYVPGLFATPGNISLLDVARVEVLRGPQGTLIGANSMGGAIRVISNEPDTEDSAGRVDLNLSSTNHGDWNYGTRFVFNQPIGNNSALRFAGLYQDDAGFIDDIGLGQADINSSSRAAGRLSWLWNASDTLEVLTRVYAENVESDGYNYADPIGRAWVNMPTDDDYQVIRYSEEPREEDLRLASMRLRWQTGWGEVYSATSWFSKDLAFSLDWSPELFFFFGLDEPAPFHTVSEQRDLSQEIRLTSEGSGPLKWLLGFYYLDQDAERRDIGSAPESAVDILDSTLDSTREDVSVFGELGWQFAESLELVVGARWYQIERTLDASTGAMFGIGETRVSGRMDDIVPKLSLSWNVTDEVMVYGTVSQGFRPGQINDQGAIEACGAREILDPDTITNYEVGVKSRLADGRVTLNATAFHIDWDDMQFDAFELLCPFPLLDNINKATSDGLEVDFNWLIAGAFSLRGGFGYNHAEISEGSEDPAFDIPPGTRMPNVPEWTANLAGTWDFNWSAQIAGYVQVDAQYIDSRTTLYDQSPGFPILEELPSYTLVNLRLGGGFGDMSGELFVTNLTDKLAELFCCRAFWDPTVSRPRTIGVRASWNFN